MTTSTDTADGRANAVAGMQVRAGTLAELRKAGQLLTKVGSLPVVVFADGDDVFAIEDRCPHMGFPLHRGTVDRGLVTCHWHHARFDLASGCTLDPFADDAQAFDVSVVNGEVFVVARPDAKASVEHLHRRLVQGLEEGLTLVTAKAVLGLLERGVAARDIVAVGIEWGTTYRERGWGSGLTVLIAMANVLPSLAEPDRAAALVHGLAFVSRDTRGSAPRFALDPLTSDVDPARLAEWYRRFVETRSGDAAERTLATAAATGAGVTGAEAMMFAAVTDHVFIDGGHTIDFTNKALESLAYIGADAAVRVLPTLAHETARASRDEESSEWRHPHDLALLVRETEPELIGSWEAARRGASMDDDAVAPLGWSLLDDDAQVVVRALLDAAERGASAEQLGRAVAFAAALRLVRFHTQNDHADWNTVHHAFTAANALHQALLRQPTPELLRGVIHGALRVHLDRFLNVPPARLPAAEPAELGELDPWWDVQGGVNEAGTIAFGYLRNGGDPAALVAHLGGALLREDVEFHWYQVFEAAVRQAHAWPDGSEEQALVLTGLARFLAAHTPTRRELSRVIDIAARLRRGEALYEDGTDEMDTSAA
jgi:nitrite reductase/ring-hydroxylating ferredoxin subunit